MSWLPKNKVVVPIDFSDHSFAALTTARQLVDSAEHLYLVHVLPRLEPAEPGVLWTTIDDESRRHHAELALRERIADTDAADAQIEIRFGDPGGEIADLAAQIGADLIVLPSHGRTGLARVLIGSVAERVARLADCPVLVLKHVLPHSA